MNQVERVGDRIVLDVEGGRIGRGTHEKVVRVRSMQIHRRKSLDDLGDGHTGQHALGCEVAFDPDRQIARDNLTELFQPFFAGDCHTKRCRDLIQHLPFRRFR